MLLAYTKASTENLDTTLASPNLVNLDRSALALSLLFFNKASKENLDTTLASPSLVNLDSSAFISLLLSFDKVSKENLDTTLARSLSRSTHTLSFTARIGLVSI
jgi:hypothetical protein